MRFSNFSVFKGFESFVIISCVLLTTACSTTNSSRDIAKNYASNIEKRQEHINQLTSWEIKGKIAFINRSERKSASLFWQKSPKSQRLNLTTYLGINVFSLSSNNQIHKLEVDGEEYQTNNLDSLLESLVGLNFPTEALSHWIKAIPFNTEDSVTYHPDTKLPTTLNSEYNNEKWLIKFASYQNIKQGVDTFLLPNKIKITSADLTIHIVINDWTIT